MKNLKTIVLTGSTGFIGSHLSSYLLKQGYRLILPVRKLPSCNVDSRLIYWRISPNWDSFSSLLKQYRPDGVIHLATHFLQSHQIDDISEMINCNIEFGIKILDVAVKADINYFLNIGTFWQHFDGNDYNPVNFYAATKQAFEVLATYYQNFYPINFVTLCLNDTFGPGDTRKKLFALWKELLTTSDKSMLMSSGEQLLDILYIDDVVDGIAHLLSMLENSSVPKLENRFYLSSNNLLSIKNLAQIFERISGKKLNVQWGAMPYRVKEVFYPKCAGKPLIGWKPKVSLEDGIRKFIMEKK